MSVNKYPVGRQDFKSIIQEGFLYVDKTAYIHQLITSHKYYFLSRPRRFGKSLLISTLDYLFKGEKELFHGFYIEDKWTFEVHPVIKISFSSLSYEEGRLKAALQEEFQVLGKQFDIEIPISEPKDAFELLIKKLHQKYNKGVVILIDEYDKPLIDYLNKQHLYLARENRSTLKSFYSILKDADPYLKLVFITGVSKFSQVSIFSDLNNLYDITMDRKYHAICGINQDELKENFVEELKVYNETKIRNWYNGYKWDVHEQSIYNPFSILRFFSGEGKFQNFWYSTGTPTFLLDKCKEMELFELKDVELSQAAINSFDIENLSLFPILFQTGYLTIAEYDNIFNSYRLDYPNKEVKSAYLEGLLERFRYDKENRTPYLMRLVLNALKNKDSDDLKEALNLAFAQIPYDLWCRLTKNSYKLKIN